MDRQNDYKNQIFYNDSGQQVLLITGKGTKNILPHWHAEIEITYITQTLPDVNQFTIDENSFEMTSGDMLFNNPYQIHSMVTQRPDTDESHRLTIILPTSFIEQYCPEISKYWIAAPHLAQHQAENQTAYLKLK